MRFSYTVAGVNAAAGVEHGLVYWPHQIISRTCQSQAEAWQPELSFPLFVCWWLACPPGMAKPRKNQDRRKPQSFTLQNS